MIPRGEPTPGGNGCRREDSGSKRLSDCTCASTCGSISRPAGRRMHHTPIRRSAPARTKLVETVTRTAASPSSTTGYQSIVCHAVEAHRFPGRRPFIPEVHPTSPRSGEGGSLSSSGARVRGNHAVSSPSSSFASCSVSAGADGGPIRQSRFGAGAGRDLPKGAWLIMT